MSDRRSSARCSDAKYGIGNGSISRTRVSDTCVKVVAQAWLSIRSCLYPPPVAGLAEMELIRGRDQVAKAEWGQSLQGQVRPRDHPAPWPLVFGRTRRVGHPNPAQS